MKKGLSIINHPDFGQVRTQLIKGEPWFVAKDVADIIDHTNSRKMIEMLDDDEKDVTKVYTPGGTQEITIVNESGLYAILLRSNKPEAKVFRKWVTSEVLPAIRKYGFYVHPSMQLSTRERNSLDREFLSEIAKYITREDIHKVAQKMRKQDRDVEWILKGYTRNNDIMRMLQERALANSKDWFDAYTDDRKREVLSILKG